MRLIANSLNGRYPDELVNEASCEKLKQIDLAVAYVLKMDSIFELAERWEVPLNLYTLADGDGFPHIEVVRKFVEGQRTAWRLYLTRDFFHPKIMWFRGVGLYLGSANLTDKAWFQNLECGVWIPEEELAELSWGPTLDPMFQSIRSRCSEATSEHLNALKALRQRRTQLTVAEQEFKKETDRLLQGIAGQHAPVDLTARRESGGSARHAFRGEWEHGLTILRKIGQLFAEHRERWPRWVERDVPPAIVQDQATEWWWHREFRSTRESRKVMAQAHTKNAANPDAVVLLLLDSWCRTAGPTDAAGEDGEDQYGIWINENPKELRRLLSPQELAKLDEHRLIGIILRCHAAKEHARQIANVDLGLELGEKRNREERCELFARYLFGHRSKKGRRVQEVLEYVLWGDKGTGRAAQEDAASRIWTAAHDDEWRLPHLGVHIFGEMLGYARPEEFPPRNNRVSKTLYALGYADITYV